MGRRHPGAHPLKLMSCSGVFGNSIRCFFTRFSSRAGGPFKGLRGVAPALAWGTVAWLGLGPLGSLPRALGADWQALETWPRDGFFSVQVRVSGRDAVFHQAGRADNSHVLLYTASQPVEVDVVGDLVDTLPEGETPLEVKLSMNFQTNVVWEVSGAVATTVIPPATNATQTVRLLLLHGEVSVTFERADGSRGTYSSFFNSVLYVARPILLSVGNAAGSLAVYTYSHVPIIATNPLVERTWVDYRTDPLPGVHVEADGLENIQVTAGVATTDDTGHARLAAEVPTSADLDEGGYVPVRVRVRATKDDSFVEREQALSIPYALVANVNGAQLVGRQGALVDPRRLIPGEVLRPGDIVQVGDELVSANTYLSLVFCNGQRVVLSSDTFGGVRAVVGQGSLNHQTSVLKVSLQNFVQEVRSDPRRFGRMLVYKELGNVLDGFLGLPDPVGWTVTTPGGAVEDWLADWAEAAYQPQSVPPRRPGPGLAGPPAPGRDAPWASTVVDFYNDGTARVYSRGATARVGGPGGAASVPQSGMTVVRHTASGGAVAAVGVAPAPDWQVALPTVAGFEPAPGTTIVSRRPLLRMDYREALGVYGNPVLPGSLVSRLDGRWVNPQSVLDAEAVRLIVPPGEALTPGEHRWEVELGTVLGAVLRTSLVFHVSGPLPAPSGLRAVAGLQKVGLRWDPEALAWARGGFRVYRTAAGGLPERVSGPQPLRQPNFVDDQPLPLASYQVAGLEESGAEGPLSAPVTVAFPGSAPRNPRALRVSVGESDSTAGPVLEIEETAADFFFWRIEAAAAPDGPFQDVLAGELTSLASWLIPHPLDETRRWWRVTAYNVDGEAGTPVGVGPLALPAPLPAVSGLTATLNTDHTVTLRWDAWSARPLAGYRVERWTGTAWSPAADVAAPAVSWTDPLPGDGATRQWRVRARPAAGGESQPSAAVALRWQPRPARPGVIRFAADSVTALEGDTVTLTVLREGGSDGPAFVTWSAWDWGGTAGPDTDYEAGAGLLVFAPGETQKTISVRLFADDQREGTETFHVSIRSVEGGPSLGVPAATVVSIAEGAELSWDPIWLSAAEGQDEPVEFRVKLNLPMPVPVSVDFRFEAESSTATPGQDFLAPLAGTLEFAPGQTERSFSLTLLDDDLKEGAQPETVKYRLLNPRGATLDDRDPFRLFATLEIRDDDTRAGRVVFAERDLRLREGQSRSFTLRRVDGADGPLDVFLFPVGGTALQGMDWTLDPPMPRFADGQTELSVTLGALSDTQSEGPELVVLAIHGHTPDGPPQMVTLLGIIEDPEPAASGFENWAASNLANAPATLRNPTADADGDGPPNWVEFLWRTDPTQPDRPALPDLKLTEWGQMQVTVTVRDDPAVVVVAEFADDVTWGEPVMDSGNWQSHGDGTRTGAFQHFNFGRDSGFVRFRAYWLGEP